MIGPPPDLPGLAPGGRPSPRAWGKFKRHFWGRSLRHQQRNAFLAKWKLRCRPVATSLEEAGERLFTFLRYPPEQWRSLRTTNAIERLHEEFKRRIKTHCLLPCADTAAMLFWALLASGQITMRRGRRLADPRPLTHRP